MLRLSHLSLCCTRASFGAQHHKKKFGSFRDSVFDFLRATGVRLGVTGIGTDIVVLRYNIEISLVFLFALHTDAGNGVCGTGIGSSRLDYTGSEHVFGSRRTRDEGVRIRQSGRDGYNPKHRLIHVQRGLMELDNGF